MSHFLFFNVIFLEILRFLSQYSPGEFLHAEKKERSREKIHLKEKNNYKRAKKKELPGISQGSHLLRSTSIKRRVSQ